jgi:hypothetical protein
MGAEEAAPGRPIFLIRIRAHDFESLRPLLLEGLDVGCRPHPEIDPEGVSIQAYVAEEAVDPIRKRGFEIDVLANLSAQWLELKDSVGKGDRFEAGRIPPQGLGIKTGGAE